MSKQQKFKRYIYNYPRVGLLSGRSSATPVYELYQTISDVQLQLNNTDFHLKELKCECKVHSMAPSSLTVSDTKTLIINCKKYNKF